MPLSVPFIHFPRWRRREVAFLPHWWRCKGAERAVEWIWKGALCEEKGGLRLEMEELSREGVEEVEATGESMTPPVPKLRQRRKSSGRVHFSEEHLAMLRADSAKHRAQRRAEEEVKMSWTFAFGALALARYFSAHSNIIHDCDEVFNYWEPLHNLLYGSGFQTWEYSSEFALRSWLYILFHAMVVKPAVWWYGSGYGKVQVFYFLRVVLGMFSAGTEAALVTGISQAYGRRLGAYTLLLLSFTSGQFAASTSFLPSTFSMYAITLAAAALLYGMPGKAAALAAVGVILGWPFSGLATIPLVMLALAAGGIVPVFLAGLGTAVSTLVLSVVADRYFYGRWTSSVFNLVNYNAFGGGDSAIFGVEGPLFYLRNGFNNFNFALPLALLFPLVAFIQKKKYYSLLVIVSPVYVWLGFMSLQAHKEERFLYPVYPLICLAAGAVIEKIPDVVPVPRYHAPNEEPTISRLAKLLRPLILAVILGLSYSRTSSLLFGYSAPLQVYQQLPQVEGASGVTGASTVCVGAEWHRFPSSFFLPSSSYKISWLDDGEKGLLPLPFNVSAGGTASAPPYFNQNNQGSSEQFVEDDGVCDFLVELKLKRSGRIYRGDDSAKWQLVWEHRYLDNELSPALHRAMFIPWIWDRKNTFGSYRLLKRNDSILL